MTVKRYRITVAGRDFEVKLLGDPRQSKVKVEVNGQQLDVQVQSAETKPAIATPEAAPPAARMPRPADTAPGGGPETQPGQVTSPLPGVIKSIAVRTGQQVAPNDVLLVIEAMKMDNVIRAARGGTIGAILVTEGRRVDYGAPLIEFAD